MSVFYRIKNRMIAAVLTRFPSLADRIAAKIDPLKFDTTPWAGVTKPLGQMTVSLITTAGVHDKNDNPFDMTNKSGDASFRIIQSAASMDSLTITHDYYDHSDADRDKNIVFPLDRLREFAAEGVIGGVARRHYGFMGHIENELLEKLVRDSAVKVAKMLKEDHVDAVLVAPG